jgi:saccharopine dehydrogenase-like NADP-dependent oxidoreductase
VIGVVGAYGDVGTCATRYLARWGAQPLRLGGRDVGAARRLAEQLPGARVECCAVDVDDAASLDRFARDCRVLLSCAGPSHAVLDRVSQAALRAGAEYVDAAGDDVLHARLSNDEYVAARRVAVLSAGLHPGLTALAPRWAALQGFTHIRSLASYFGLRDDFTPTAADDYLEGAERSISLPLAAC